MSVSITVPWFFYHEASIESQKCNVSLTEIIYRDYCRLAELFPYLHFFNLEQIDTSLGIT